VCGLYVSLSHLTTPTFSVSLSSLSSQDRNATISLAIQEGAAEEKKLSSQVVSSPDRVRREMANATDRLEAEKKEAVRIEKEALRVKAKAVEAAKVAKEVSRNICWSVCLVLLLLLLLLFFLSLVLVLSTHLFFTPYYFILCLCSFPFSF